MREFLFRGKKKCHPWNADFDAWFYGDLITNTDDWQINTSNGEVAYIFRESVGQFTGLLDKENTKIFEGDILEFIDDENNITNYTVDWDIENCRFIIQQVGCDTPNEVEAWVSDYMKVIGNIYDNPELLMVKS